MKIRPVFYVSLEASRGKITARLEVRTHGHAGSGRLNLDTRWDFSLLVAVGGSSNAGFESAVVVNYSTKISVTAISVGIELSSCLVTCRHQGQSIINSLASS